MTTTDLDTAKNAFKSTGWVSQAKHTALKRALQHSSRTRNVNLTARLMAWACSYDAGSKRPRALLTNENKDGIKADAIASLGKDFDVAAWPGYVLKACSKSFLLDKIQDANTYRTEDPETEDYKRQLRAFYVLVWKKFQTLVRVDVVITANFGFTPEREFGAALSELAVPFVVIQKENLNGITPKRWAFWHSAYQGRGAFKGKRILTYNAVERDLQISSSIASAEQIEVTGMPRLDRMHAWRKLHSGQRNGKENHVLFFAFDRRDKIPPGAEHEGLGWGDFCKSVHESMIALAAENPSIQVTIKTKSQTAQRVDIMSVLQQHDLSLSNLRIVSGGDPTELIKDAHVVVGFNTTALLEALAAGKRVIFPRFSEATADSLQPFILDLGNAVEYAESGDDLKQRIKSCLSRTEEVPFDLPVSTTAILKKWVGNDDGLASERVLAAVKATLTQ